MGKLYKHNKGKIHPSPPRPATVDHLSLLPIALATLAAALAPDDQEILAYLLSCSVPTTTTNKNYFSGKSRPAKKTNRGGGSGSHPPQFNCNCFTCYTSYWVRWNASPNQQLIHEIIDKYEDSLINNEKRGKNKKERRKNRVGPSAPHAPVTPAEKFPHARVTPAEKVPHAPPQVEESKIENDNDDGGDQDNLVIGSSPEKGPLRKFVSFIGGRIWNVWGI